jgi:hypothetical protein
MSDPAVILVSSTKGNPMNTPSFGQLVDQVKSAHNYSDAQAYAYLASAFFTLASDEDVERVSETIGISLR